MTNSDAYPLIRITKRVRGLNLEPGAQTRLPSNQSKRLVDGDAAVYVAEPQSVASKEAAPATNKPAKAASTKSAEKPSDTAAAS